MAVQSLVFGLLLTGLAAFGYLGAAEESPSRTALIPLAVGLPLLLCGLVGMNERYRKHAMHLAAGFAAVGTLASGGRGIQSLLKLLSGGSEVNSRAVTLVLIMFLLCAIVLGLCVKSFVDARRRQQAEAN